MNFWIAACLVLLGFLVGYFVGVGRGRSTLRDPVGHLAIVDWEDGSVDVLLETSIPPSDMQDGQMIGLLVRRTRGNHRL